MSIHENIQNLNEKEKDDIICKDYDFNDFNKTCFTQQNCNNNDEWHENTKVS